MVWAWRTTVNATVEPEEEKKIDREARACLRLSIKVRHYFSKT
jgi:hypothetical protein